MMLLGDAIGAYAADRRAKGAKAGTLRSEGLVLRHLLGSAGNIHVHNLRPIHLDRFWESRVGAWGPATCNRARTQLNVFFTWCQVRGYLPRTTDLLEGTRNQRVPKVDRTVIPQGQFGELLDSAANPRDRAILAIGLYLFTRVSETAELRWRDIDFENKTVTIYRVKTSEDDTLPMCEELEDELRKWRLAYGASVGEVPLPGWYVCPPYSTPKFVGKTGGGLYLTERGELRPTHKMTVVARPIKRALSEIGLDGNREGGHTLRRSGAIALYHQLASVGHDRAIRMCQAMLGHASIQTTEIYLRLDLDRKARNDLLAGKRMFPKADGGQVLELGVSDDKESRGTV